ncbi:MAG: ComF family protein [Acidobacteria bacterium]|nr:ComF family protein [Acidobacteriota bacterium]
MKLVFSAKKWLFPLLQDSATALVYPTLCRVCEASIDSLDDGITCRHCWLENENARLNFDHCEKCDASLPRLHLKPQARSCGKCESFAFTDARACGIYKGSLREAVLALKRQPNIPEHLQKLILATFWQLPETDKIELIVPVPLHPSRLRERGYNQAELIAQVLARQVQLPIAKTALQRQQETERHRAGMNIEQRMKSLAGAFTIAAPRLIAERSILLVDDVMTTGSTAHEIATILLDSGARKVQVLTVARAMTVFG